MSTTSGQPKESHHGLALPERLHGKREGGFALIELIMIVLIALARDTAATCAKPSLADVSATSW
jgi:hypothetical protein